MSLVFFINENTSLDRRVGRERHLFGFVSCRKKHHYFRQRVHTSGVDRIFRAFAYGGCSIEQLLLR
jgi:hypothetical protein